MAHKAQRCPDCGRSVDECLVPVDESTWPQAAVDAYALAALPTAATCPKGQLRDLRTTVHGPRPGWCLDRVVRHPEYTGEPIPGLQRDVRGAARARERRTSA